MLSLSAVCITGVHAIRNEWRCDRNATSIPGQRFVDKYMEEAERHVPVSKRRVDGLGFLPIGDFRGSAPASCAQMVALSSQLQETAFNIHTYIPWCIQVGEAAGT